MKLRFITWLIAFLVSSLEGSLRFTEDTYDIVARGKTKVFPEIEYIAPNSSRKGYTQLQFRSARIGIDLWAMSDLDRSGIQFQWFKDALTFMEE